VYLISGLPRYCVILLDEAEEAKETLLRAPEAISSTPLYCYNLACYEAQIGHTESAKLLLTECFTKDAKMKATALEDPDLEPIWDSLWMNAHNRD
jgi:hypothetical protein